MKKNKCNDCKYNSGLCKVCIKDKLFYVGIDYDNEDNRKMKENKEDVIYYGLGGF